MMYGILSVYESGFQTGFRQYNSGVPQLTQMNSRHVMFHSIPKTCSIMKSILFKKYFLAFW